ncbi:hypothetical protein KGI96_02200 [Phocoenobacter atlanticus subsp. cyclopteri]|uniref:hypothetical protein n=1 Tax=Phocoenobacter atlanticus TaxID=3416742 RepID=UPI001BC96FE7|nr:hypothetical protein [Pasteurella atlantica]QVE21228.1 hypothetical protein KGI96_02200 [Pasteurella atlantica]
MSYRFKEPHLDDEYFACYVDFFRVPENIVLENLLTTTLKEIKLGEVEKKFPNWIFGESCIGYAAIGNNIETSWLLPPFKYVKDMKWKYFYEDPDILVKGSMKYIDVGKLASNNISRLFASSYGQNSYRGLAYYPKQNIIRVVTGCEMATDNCGNN